MQIHALGHMAPLGCAPKPVSVASPSKHAFTPGERIGLWTVGEERRVEPSYALVRICVCVCGRISHVPLAALAKHRERNTGGCRKCVARKGAGVDPVSVANVPTPMDTNVERAASRAVAKITVGTRVEGALQQIRDLTDRHDVHRAALRIELDRIVRRERAAGHAAAAAWLDALLRLDGYAREGG